VRRIGNAAEALAAASGLVLSTYTGVLIGATAIPAWSANVRVLPMHFAASGVGAAVAILELLGHRDRALNVLGAGAAAVETLIGAGLELRESEALAALKDDWTGAVTRMGGVLSGPLPLALRLVAGRSPSARKAAAISAIMGSLMTRVGWLSAGRSSIEGPKSGARS
jgi:formate-dependent nitrite reductase membrane component NrfD